MVESARGLAPAAPQHAQVEWWTLWRRGMGGRRVWWVFVRRCAPALTSSCAAHPGPPAGGSAAADRCRELGSSTASAAASIVANSGFPPRKGSGAPVLHPLES